MTESIRKLGTALLAFALAFTMTVPVLSLMSVSTAYADEPVYTDAKAQFLRTANDKPSTTGAAGTVAVNESVAKEFNVDASSLVGRVAHFRYNGNEASAQISETFASPTTYQFKICNSVATTLNGGTAVSGTKDITYYIEGLVKEAPTWTLSVEYLDAATGSVLTSADKPFIASLPTTVTCKYDGAQLPASLTDSEEITAQINLPSELGSIDRIVRTMSNSTDHTGTISVYLGEGEDPSVSFDVTYDPQLPFGDSVKITYDNLSATAPYPFSEWSYDGFDFVGWSTTGSPDNVILPDASLSSLNPVNAGSYVLYAVWDVKPSYNLTLNFGTSTNSAGVLPRVQVTEGQYYTLPSATQLTRDGYQLVGWYYRDTVTVPGYDEVNVGTSTGKASQRASMVASLDTGVDPILGGEKFTPAGSAFEMPSRNVTLYAVWAASGTTPYTARYYKVGGNGKLSLWLEANATGVTDEFCEIADPSDASEVAGVSYASLIESVDWRGYSADKFNVVAFDGDPRGFDSDPSLSFSFDGVEGQCRANIVADGSTVISLVMEALPLSLNLDPGLVRDDGTHDFDWTDESGNVLSDMPQKYRDYIYTGSDGTGVRDANALDLPSATDLKRLGYELKGWYYAEQVETADYGMVFVNASEGDAAIAAANAAMADTGRTDGVPHFVSVEDKLTMPNHDVNLYAVWMPVSATDPDTPDNPDDPAIPMELRAQLKLVTPDETAKGVTYSVFKLFDADIEGDSQDPTAPKASNLAFAPGFDESLIPTTDVDLSNPQDAAEYISSKIAHAPGVDLDASSFGMQLARNVRDAGMTATQVTADSLEFTALSTSGYYLIIKTDRELDGDDDSDGNSDPIPSFTAATSPIFAALKTGENVIALKTALPYVTKEVQEDSTGEWGEVADASNGQVVNYRITGTVAENIAAYDTYFYRFHDYHNESFSLDESSIVVTVDGKNVTDQANIDLADSFIVTFSDLKALNDPDIPDAKIAITPDTSVVLAYSVTLDSDNVIAGDGNQNDVHLEYSNNPMTDSKGFTKIKSARVYTYGLTIQKVDNATNQHLEGVTFYVQNSSGKYMALDGTEHDDPQLLTTDGDGCIMIPRVDADTYTATEVTPLDHYAPFTGTAKLTISPVYADTDDDGNAFDLSAVNGSLADDAYVVPGIIGRVSGASTELINPDGQFAQMTIKNIKWVDMPSTGGYGTAFGLIVGIVLLSAAAANRIHRRSRDA